MSQTPEEILTKAAALNRAKTKEYGNMPKVIGEIQHALFPKGLVLHTPEDFNRYHLFM